MAKKILLADDSLTIQKVVELTFSDSDYELICVSNGQRALEKVWEDRPDLILADVVMPEKNGYEVCEAIKGDPLTARIPVVLLSGTFEPFDRERAERIGADAIVSKPFDSQQLLSQVDALLDRSQATSGASAVAETEPQPQKTAAIAIPRLPEPPATPPVPSTEEPPFDVGFSSEDFTASLRAAPGRSSVDPFEEEYGRGDVESAIEAFEKAHPRFGFGSDVEGGVEPLIAEQPLRRADAGREPQWLREEPEKSSSSTPSSEPPDSMDSEPDSGQMSTAATIAISRSDFAPLRADEMPTRKFSQSTVDRRPAAETEDAGLESSLASSESSRASTMESSPTVETTPEAPAAMEISAQDAEVLFDVSSDAAPALQDSPEDGDTADAPAGGPSDGSAPEVPGEIEMLAQRSSIMELTQMLSNVRSGGEMTEEQLERLAARVVEKLSDRIVREIAWEVIPDMAEIVIKQRIKELESGIE